MYELRMDDGSDLVVREVATLEEGLAALEGAGQVLREQLAVNAEGGEVVLRLCLVEMRSGMALGWARVAANAPASRSRP